VGAIVETYSQTYEELTAEFLGCSNYYFSNSPVGMRQFGSLPSSGEVYIRQQSTLKSAVEEMVTDDPLEISIDQDGKGSIELHVPIPRGCQLTLRELHFSEDPKVRTFHLNGTGPISFKYCSHGIGVVEHALPSFESALVFSRIGHITKAIIHMTPCDTISAIEMFFPGAAVIQLTDYFKFTEQPFHRFEDHSYRCTWHSNGRCLKAIELPSGFLNWHIIVNEVLLNNKNGIAPVEVDAERVDIVLVPPEPINVKTVKARVFYQKGVTETHAQVAKLKSHLQKAEKEIRRLQQICKG
jgi:hypothetical protein